MKDINDVKCARINGDDNSGKIVSNTVAPFFKIITDGLQCIFFKDTGPKTYGDLYITGRRIFTASSGRSEHYTSVADILDHCQSALRLLVLQKNWQAALDRRQNTLDEFLYLLEGNP